MNPDSVPTPPASPGKTTEQIAEAHQLLKTLRLRLGEHPELDEAITKLEMVLSALTLQTGGLL
jgi:hypothetical protein